MATEWERKNNIIAERFKKDEMHAMFKREFHAKNNEFVLFEKDNEIYEEMGSGNISMPPGDFTGITIVDKSEKIISGSLKSVAFSDGGRADMEFIIKFRVVHSEKFYERAIFDRKTLSLDDIWDDILSHVLYKEILPRIESMESSSFSENEINNRTRSVLSDFLMRKGMSISDFKLSCVIKKPGHPESVLQEEDNASYDDMQREIKNSKNS